MRFHGLHIHHPAPHERENGEESHVWIGATTPGGSLRRINLTEDELLRLLEEGTKYLRILRKVGR